MTTPSHIQIRLHSNLPTPRTLEVGTSACDSVELWLDCGSEYVNDELTPPVRLCWIDLDRLQAGILGAALVAMSRPKETD